jgi:hypothetical protein
VIKVMWFLKRAQHLSLEEFRVWWLTRHCHDVARAQAPYLLRYVINVRAAEDDLAGKPDAEPEWDGVAEQWFADARAFNAVYGRPSTTRPDTLANTSRFQRLVVSEHEIAAPESRADARVDEGV